MKVYKQFLPKKIFSELKKAVMGDFFPWYFNDFINIKKEKDFQFTFVFMMNNKYQCWGKWQEIMIPVLKKIKHKKMNRVKANLLTRTDKIIEHKYHVDQEKGTTGILYLNNCNGYTIFENGKKITSEENKYVEFDSSLRHTGSSCTDEKRRVVINFNYEFV